jgi:hypothetical protein
LSQNANKWNHLYCTLVHLVSAVAAI